MKFVHIADMHFDSPFVNLSNKEMLGDIRRLDQRKIFKKVITYIKENDIPFLFISGDLYEHKYIKYSTIQYIDNLFQEIPNTQIYISPGNHDPYLKNSYYEQFKWSKNVHIFNSKLEKVSTQDADIYGYGFNDFYCNGCGIEKLEIENPAKLNIAVIHGDLNSSNTEEEQYNPISIKILKDKGFDYVAMGHIHKPSYKDEPDQRIVYPGSTISQGFDELGEHGMIVGEVTKNNIHLELIPLDEKAFVEKQIDVTDILSREELIEKINQEDYLETEFIKIILTGFRHFEIDIYKIYQFIESNQIIKIKDKTKPYYDLEKIKNDSTLKGMFAKEILEKLQNPELSEEEKEILEKSIEIAFEALQ